VAPVTGRDKVARSLVIAYLFVETLHAMHGIILVVVCIELDAKIAAELWDCRHLFYLSGELLGSPLFLY
jgi:hypothetical protein